MPFFSIVMPSYGVEEYIETAVACIQKQTVSDWELIIVEDSSPDRTGQIAESLAKTDDRIRVIHHEQNQGLSGARNTGTNAASGQYIWFMDPDDTVDEDLLELVFNSLRKNPAKLVLFGLNEEYYDREGNFGYRHTVSPEDGYYTTAVELRPHILGLEQETLYGYAWNKFYHLEYLRSIRLAFETVTLIEDIVFNIKFCMDIDSMNTLAAAPYHYAKRLENSLTNKFVPDYYKLHKERIQMLYDQHEYWGMCTAEVLEVLGGLYGRYILSAMERNCDKRADMNHGKRIRWCERLFEQKLFQRLIPKAQARDSKVLAVWLKVLKKERPVPCIIMGRLVYIIRHKLPFLYSKTKSGR